ncbi:MAG: Gfo/Idh/MocA family protein [Alphaproteobacteria bacterium]
MGTVRLAVIGAGGIGRKHIETIAGTDSCDLIAIADPDPVAQSIAAPHNVPCYDDHVAMLSVEQPDGVIIATPTHNHASIALDSLRAGVHLLIEKPIAATVAEAEGISDQARKSGRHVLVGHHRRYNGAVNTTRQAVQSGQLGNLVAVTGQWTALKPDSYFKPEWRRKSEAGPVLTNLVHEIDTLRTVCGDITGISAVTSNAARGHEAEDTVALLMQFAKGALGTFLLSDVTPSPWTWEFATGENPVFPQHHQNVIRFMGTEAALEFPNLRIWRHADGERGWHHLVTPHNVPFSLGDAFAAQCAHFCAVISGEEQPRVTAEDATRSLAATVAVFEAMDTARQVKL